MVVGGWAKPLQPLPQGLVLSLTFDFDFDPDPDPDPELDNILNLKGHIYIKRDQKLIFEFL